MHRENGLNLSRDFKPHKKLDFNPLIPPIELSLIYELKTDWALDAEFQSFSGSGRERGGNNLAGF